jgi:hypothetical protein
MGTSKASCYIKKYFVISNVYDNIKCNGRVTTKGTFWLRAETFSLKPDRSGLLTWGGN